MGNLFVKMAEGLGALNWKIHFLLIRAFWSLSLLWNLVQNCRMRMSSWRLVSVRAQHLPLKSRRKSSHSKTQRSEGLARGPSQLHSILGTCTSLRAEAEALGKASYCSLTASRIFVRTFTQMCHMADGMGWGL